MQNRTKAVGSGNTGLADALAVALKLNAHKQLTQVANAGGRGAQVARTALAVMDTAENIAEAASTGGVKEMAKAIIKGSQAVRDAAEPRNTAPPFRKGGHGRDFGKMHYDEAAKVLVAKGELMRTPDPREERRKREEQAKTITKHCAVIKRTDPRLLAELLQTFGSLEGLSAPKQADLIGKLEAIRKDYRI